MNGSLLAAIAVVALIVAVLLLKKRTSQKKTPQIEAVEPTDTAIQESAPAPAEEPPAETASVFAAEESEAKSLAAAGIALPSEAGPALEAVAIDLEKDTTLADIDEGVVITELEEAAAEIPVEEAMAQAEEVPAVLEKPEPVFFAIEEIPEPSGVQPEQTVEEEPLPVRDEVAPAAAVETEETSPAAESIAEPQPEPVEEEIVASEITAEPVAAMEALPEVALTLAAYSARLNDLEAKQRAVLAQAIQRRDDELRDRLQRELVIMNDRLALLTDSYAEEMGRYQQILTTLEQLGDKGEDAQLSAAIENLRAGEPQAAEAFFAQLSEQQHPFAARAAYHSGQLAESRVDLQKALDRYRRAVEWEPENPRYLQAAGKTARSLYKYKEALLWLESFVSLSRENQETEAIDLALAQRELAYTYLLSGQYQKAGPLYKELMTVLAKKLGQNHPEMATSWYQIGELQETLGEYDKAVSLYKKSLEILEHERGQEHPTLAGILDKLAALCMELEMEKQAVPLYERLVRIREKALRPTHPQLALSLNNLAESYRLQGQYAEAEACYQKSLVINETLHGKEHPSVAAVLQELARLCASQRKQEEADQYQHRASAIFQKSVEASEKKTGQESLTLEI